MSDFIYGSRDLNKLYQEATRLNPRGPVRLIHVNAQDVEPGDGAIGAGHHYFHYNFIPHTKDDLYAAANILMPKDDVRTKGQVTRMTKAVNPNTVTYTSTAADPNFLYPVNFNGAKYQKVAIEVQWLVTPPDGLYQLYWSTPNHPIGPSYIKSGTRASVATRLESNWYRLEFDLSDNADWTSSTITNLRFDLWQEAVGSVVVRKIEFLNKDQRDYDPAKLGPKSLSFGGQVYDFWPFEITGLALDTEQSPEPQFSLVDIDGLITRLCLNHRNLVGATVEIIDTFANFLDNGSTPDPDQYMRESWIIDNVPARTPGTVISFGLASPASLETAEAPRRQILNICTWQLDGRYGSGVGCSWDRAKPGIKYYDAKGNEVDDVSKDACGGCLADCRKRFGQGLPDPNAAILDFGGFPGAHLQNG